MSDRDGLGRRRRASVPGGRRVVHKVRVSPEEETALLALAGGDPLRVARLLVESALADGGETPTARREVMVELFACRRELARVGVNVNQLARKANVGDGFPVEDARGYLVASRALAARIDAAIDRLSAEGVAV